MYVSVCMYMHMCEQVSMEISDPWALELQASVSHPAPVVMAEQQALLTTDPSLQPLRIATLWTMTCMSPS